MTPKATKNGVEIDCPAMRALTKGLEKAKLRPDGHVGFNFSARYPYYWFLYTFNGCKYVQLELLLPTADPADLSLSISEDGKHFIIKNLVMAEILLHSNFYQRRFGIPNQNLGDHLLNQAGIAAQQYVREQIGEDGAWSVMVVALPFACQQQFTDPYTPVGTEDTGTALSYFKHPRYVAPPLPDITVPAQVQAYLDAMIANPLRRVCIMSLTFKSAVLPKPLRGAAMPQTIYDDL